MQKWVWLWPINTRPRMGSSVEVLKRLPEGKAEKGKAVCQVPMLFAKKFQSLGCLFFLAPC